MSGNVKHFDTLVAGAGIAGICAAWHLKKDRPNKTFVVLERRHEIGGTWDFFKYPGLRIDTDVMTYAYSFHPVKYQKRMPNAKEIMAYLREVVDTYDLRKHIDFGQYIESADFSTKEGLWTVRTKGGDVYTCRWYINATGYFSYEQPHIPDIPGMDEFRAQPGKQLVHSMHWDPKAVPYEGKDVVIIGSGATAVTMAPAVANGGAKTTTVLQRTPGFINNWPQLGTDKAGWIAIWTIMVLEAILLIIFVAVGETSCCGYPIALLASILPILSVLVLLQIFLFIMYTPGISRRLLGTSQRSYDFHRWWEKTSISLLMRNIMKHPKLFGWIVKRDTMNRIGDRRLTRHFTPPYKLWDQRCTFCPDWDFHDAVRDGDIKMVTTHIEKFTASGIDLKPLDEKQQELADCYGEEPSPANLEADIVVLATGFKLQLGGGAKYSVDGKVYNSSDLMTYMSFMAAPLPNWSILLGYTMGAWTLKVEMNVKKTIHMLNILDKEGSAFVYPKPDPTHEPCNLLNLKSSYISRGATRPDGLPVQGKNPGEEFRCLGDSDSPWAYTPYYDTEDRNTRRWLRNVTADGILQFSSAEASQKIEVVVLGYEECKSQRGCLSQEDDDVKEPRSDFI